MICDLTKEELATAFFRLRFSKDPTADPSYFETWKRRFLDKPEAYMDNQSKAIYEIIKKACDIK